MICLARIQSDFATHVEFGVTRCEPSVYVKKIGLQASDCEMIPMSHLWQCVEARHLQTGDIIEIAWHTNTIGRTGYNQFRAFCRVCKIHETEIYTVNYVSPLDAIYMAARAKETLQVVTEQDLDRALDGV